MKPPEGTLRGEGVLLVDGEDLCPVSFEIKIANGQARGALTGDAARLLGVSLSSEFVLKERDDRSVRILVDDIRGDGRVRFRV